MLVAAPVICGIIHWICGPNTGRGGLAGPVVSLMLLPIEFLTALIFAIALAQQWKRMEDSPMVFGGMTLSVLIIAVAAIVLIIWVKPGDSTAAGRQTLPSTRSP